MHRIPVFARLALIAVLSGGCTVLQPVDEEADVLVSLTTFLRAFENGNIDVMEASFASDAQTFPRAVMSSETAGPIQTSAYRRVTGLPPGMRALVSSWDGSATGPPYMTLEPQDLKVQLFGDAAVVSFHLENGSMLSRRTIVLAKEAGLWQIVHLHASNVVGSE